MKTHQVCPVDILAAGSDLKNTFSLVKKDQIICSEHIGDLEDAEVYHHYIESIEHLKGLFEAEPKVVVCDLHPTYLSTQYAKSLSDVEVMEVQHHWAHIASVIAENHIDDPVIGLACDGVGFGPDGAVWGCECMIATLESFQRLGHLKYYRLPGADKASKEPIRPLLGLINQAYNGNFDLQNLAGLIDIDSQKANVIVEQIQKEFNTVNTSSLGRVFDAAATLLGLGDYNHFEAQLPMALESIAAKKIDQQYDFELQDDSDNTFVLDLSAMLRQMIEEVKANTDKGVISAKFHNTVAAGLLAMAEKARQISEISVVALSGGVFCNRYLSNRLIGLLKTSGFTVLCNREFPTNDGGISLGQGAIGAKIISNRE